jgi:hypothetical protein
MAVNINDEKRIFYYSQCSVSVGGSEYFRSRHKLKTIERGDYPCR